jgi:3',5'-cyclic AMP phosphodiesterase CpdA
MSETLKFVHVTDLHLSPPGESLWGLDPHDRFTRCLDDIEKWHGDAEFCIISGDLADAGRAEAYDWLREQLAGFSIPTHLMIGNHDAREAFRSAFPDAPTDDHGFIQHAFDTRHGRFLLLDTYKGQTSAGEYCKRRRGWLEKQLAEATEQPVWIFMHHPPFDIQIPYMDRIKLDEPEAFSTLLNQHGNIRHLFYGHVHRPGYANWNGIPCTSLPGINHQVPLVRDAVGGTSYSVEPPMYGVVYAGDDQTTVHFDAYLDRTAADMSARE